MVVTTSLARGAVRAAVERHNEAHADFHSRIDKTSFAPPSTLRRFEEWLRKRTAVHDRHALLIYRGMIRRRSAAFVAFHPIFMPHEPGWNLGIYELRIVISPGKIETLKTTDLPIQISGHALERMFQRTNEIRWSVIREYLASAIAFSVAVLPAYIESGCKQCAIPADRGLLVGQITDRTIRLQTFLPDTQLAFRWQALNDGLVRFSSEHQEAIAAAGILHDEELALGFQRFLGENRYSWLFKPYVQGVDSLEDAWRSREA